MPANIVDTARQYLGQKYVWGGESREEGGFDCSGLVAAAAKDAGLNVGRNTADGYWRSLGTEITQDQLQPGDLVFWAGSVRRSGLRSQSPPGRRVTHVGIYAGNGHIIDASSSKNAVVYRKMWGDPIGFKRITGQPPASSSDEMQQLAGLSEADQKALRDMADQGLTQEDVVALAASGVKGTTTQDTLPADANPQQVEEFVRERYPQAVFLLNLPEIRPLILEGAQKGWSVDRLRGAIEKSDWFQTTSNTTRQWDELLATDPATANRRIDQQVALFRDQAARVGRSPTEPLLRQWATDSLRYGWSQQEITDRLVAGLDFGKQLRGDARTTLQTLRGMASDYAVPVDRKTLEFWTQKVLAGEQDEDDFKGYLVGQAIGLFRGNDTVTKQLESGFNLRQVASATLGYAARELEIGDTSTIDLLDPKWMTLLHTFDPDSKTFRPMTASEVIKKVRTDSVYGFDNTTNARQTAAQFAQQLGETFGSAA